MPDEVAICGEMAIFSEQEIVTTRKQVRDLAKSMGFGVTDITRIVTAASELTRNIQQYAHAGGVMRWAFLEQKDRVGLELSFEDSGPGIDDLNLVMQEGYSSSRSLGMGLPGAKRLMDELEITSTLGQGTCVVVRKWMHKR